MAEINEEPPGENEQYEQLDEALDEEDLPGHDGAPEGRRDLNQDIVADSAALEEIGADLDDPERMAVLLHGVDHPDGSGPSAE